MKVLVAGTHGNSGRMMIQNLVGKGHEAYAMVRNKDQGPDLKK